MEKNIISIWYYDLESISFVIMMINEMIKYVDEIERKVNENESL